MQCPHPRRVSTAKYQERKTMCKILIIVATFGLLGGAAIAGGLSAIDHSHDEVSGEGDPIFSVA